MPPPRSRAFLKRRSKRREQMAALGRERSRARLNALLDTEHLVEYMEVFERDQVRYEHLEKLTPGDIKTLGIPLGVAVNIIAAFQKQKAAETTDGTVRMGFQAGGTL